MDSLKAPSTAVSQLSTYYIRLRLTIISRNPTQKASLRALLRLYSWHAPILHRGNTISGFLCDISNLLYSDEYWKLYENYTGVLKKIAEVQDTLEIAKKDLSDTQAERKSAITSYPSKYPLLTISKLALSTKSKSTCFAASKSTTQLN
jgi:protein HOOK3